MDTMRPSRSFVLVDGALPICGTGMAVSDPKPRLCAIGQRRRHRQ